MIHTRCEPWHSWGPGPWEGGAAGLADLLVAGAKCRRDVGRCRTVASLPLLPRPLALLPAPRPTQLRTPLWIFLPALPLLPSWPLTLHPQASSPGGGEHVRITHPVLWFMGLGGGNFPIAYKAPTHTEERLQGPCEPVPRSLVGQHAVLPEPQAEPQIPTAAAAVAWTAPSPRRLDEDWK